MSGPVPRNDSLATPPDVGRQGSYQSDKMGVLVHSAEVNEKELDKLDEYEEVIAAESEFT